MSAELRSASGEYLGDVPAQHDFERAVWYAVRYLAREEGERVEAWLDGERIAFADPVPEAAR